MELFPAPVTLSRIQLQCYRSLRQLHSEFGHIRYGGRHVMTIARAESNPDIGLLTRQTFLVFSHDAQATDNKMLIVPISLASVRGLEGRSEMSVVYTTSPLCGLMSAIAISMS